MTVLRYNNVHTTLATSLDNMDSSIDLAGPLAEGGVNVPTLSGGDVILLGIEDEVVELTAYTAGGTTGTITRGYGDTAAVAHAAGTRVANVATKADMIGQPAAAPQTFDSGDTDTNRIAALEAIILAYQLATDTA